MVLYHFSTSPYSRRVRLALALKGLHAELRDARAQPAHLKALCELNPFHTVPVLLDGEHVVIDSAAICQYLERMQPTPPLWPSGMAGADAFQICALADGVINPLIELGLRYAPLSDHAQFPEVKAKVLGRAQRGLDALAARVLQRPHGPLCGDAWSMADIALFTTVFWLETMPERVTVFPPAAVMLSLGWTLPPPLLAWLEQHRTRQDVLALS